MRWNYTVPLMTFFLHPTIRFSVLVPTKLNSVSQIEPKSARLGSLVIVHRTASEEILQIPEKRPLNIKFKDPNQRRKEADGRDPEPEESPGRGGEAD